MVEDDKNRKVKKKLTEKDIEILSQVLENVTVTKSGMLRMSSFFVPNPKFDREFSEGMKAMQQIPEAIKQLTQVLTKISMDVSDIKSKQQ